MANKEMLARLADAGILPPGEAVRMADYDATAKPRARKFMSAQMTNLTSSWTTQPKPIDSDIKDGLRRLRARTRHEAQNNDYVKKFLKLVKDNVIGAQGIILRAQIKDLSGTKDPLASKAIEAGWLEWGKKGTADVTGRHSWRMVQRLFIETVARDGEVLVRKLRGWKGNKFRFALQFLDSELLDVDLNHDLKNGNTIRMGVELNEWRRPVAYYLLSTKPTADDYTFIGRKYVRVPADEIYHEFLPEWVWQTRGIPWASTGLLRMNMLSGYEEAELVASRAGAAKFGTYDPVDTETGPSPAMADETGGLEKDADGRFIEDFAAGTIGITPEGYKFNLIDPQHPNSAYKDFVKACLRGISSGLGVSYNSLANDLEGVNYNSLRKGALDERDVWMALQDWVVESFCEPVYSDWLELSLLSGALKINNRPLRVNDEEKYKQVGWQPRRWPWVDPAKEATTHEKQFASKTRAPQSVVREMGEDWIEVLDQWEEWNNELEARGLKMESSPATPTPTPSNEDDEEGNNNAATESGDDSEK